MIYEPTLKSVKTHPLPAWYDDAKFGIFVHWSLSSVPAFAPRGELFAEKMIKGELGFAYSPYAEWYQNSLRIPGSPVYDYHLKTYGQDYPYARFAPQFNAHLEAWDPEAWADLFARAGARYVVFVTKHHDGFLLWNSRHHNPYINEWQTPRDVTGELSEAVKDRGLKFGVYYSSLLDWTFTREPIKTLADLVAGSDTSPQYRAYIEKHWLELIERYDPWILWSDIGYPPGYNLPKLFAHYYNRRPEGVIDDRWMQLPRFLFNRPARAVLNLLLKAVKTAEPPPVPHSDFLTPEYAALDHITKHKWETCRGIGSSFGYNQFEDAGDYKKPEELIRLLADVVSKNGNLLLNVGPRSDGTIHPLQVAAVEGIGKWLAANGECIYGSRPWIRYRDIDPAGGEVRYTTKEGARYAIVTRLPESKVLALPPDVDGDMTLLSSGARLHVDRSGGKLCISLPPGTGGEAVPVIKTK
jgi:alpha-L-fucosidase